MKEINIFFLPVNICVLKSTFALTSIRFICHFFFMNLAYWYVTMFDKNQKTEKIGTILNEIEVTPTTIQHSDLFACIYIITGLLIVSILYKLFKIAQRYMKKKYQNNQII